jgi:hypothetical protein
VARLQRRLSYRCNIAGHQLLLVLSAGRVHNVMSVVIQCQVASVHVTDNLTR